MQKSYSFCIHTLSPLERRQGRDIPRSLPRKFAEVGIGLGGRRVGVDGVKVGVGMREFRMRARVVLQSEEGGGEGVEDGVWLGVRMGLGMS